MATGNNTKEQSITNKILADNIRVIRQNMKMNQHFTFLGFLSSLSLWLIPAVLDAREPQIEVEQILQTTQSWDGIQYKSYPGLCPFSIYYFGLSGLRCASFTWKKLNPLQNKIAPDSNEQCLL